MTGEEIDREYQRAAMRAEELESLAAGLRRLSGEEYESALSDIRCAMSPLWEQLSMLTRAMGRRPFLYLS